MRACPRGRRRWSSALALATGVLLARGSPAASPAPLSRLAESLASEIVAAARGRAVEIGAAEDRTGSGGTVALDFQSLLRARLEGHARLAASGPRLRVDCVLAEAPGRLWVSARLTEEPGGRLVDVLAVSAESDPMLLSLVPTRPTGGSGSLAVTGSRRTPPVEGRVLDLTLVGEDRLLVLYDGALALYRLEDAGLVVLSRRELPAPLPPVRFPGGTILLASAEGSAWVLTSRSPAALLFAIDGGRLEERQQAEALPWPRAPRGLRYRPGTNLVEADVEGLGEGPFLRLDRGMAVTAEGRLRVASPEGGRTLDVRTGPGLARLGPELVAVPGGDPPGPKDVVLLLDAHDPGRPPVQSVPVEGSVRAMAGRAGADGRMRLVAAVEEERGTHLVLVDLASVAP